MTRAALKEELDRAFEAVSRLRKAHSEYCGERDIEIKDPSNLSIRDLLKDAVRITKSTD